MRFNSVTNAFFSFVGSLNAGGVGAETSNHLSGRHRRNVLSLQLISHTLVCIMGSVTRSPGPLPPSFGHAESHRGETGQAVGASVAQAARRGLRVGRGVREWPPRTRRRLRGRGGGGASSHPSEAGRSAGERRRTRGNGRNHPGRRRVQRTRRGRAREATSLCQATRCRALLTLVCSKCRRKHMFPWAFKESTNLEML